MNHICNVQLFCQNILDCMLSLFQNILGDEKIVREKCNGECRFIFIFLF